jgi:hypothetical protein
MRSTSPPADQGLSRRDSRRTATLLDELLCIDGVTDLAVYRLLTGRGQDLIDVTPPPRPEPPDPGLQLGALILVRGGRR